MRTEALLLTKEVLEYYGFTESVEAFSREFAKKEHALETLSAPSLAEKAGAFLKEAPEILTRYRPTDSAEAWSTDDPVYWCRHPDRLFQHFVAALDEKRHSDLFALSELFLSRRLLTFEDLSVSTDAFRREQSSLIEQAMVLRYFLHIFWATTEERGKHGMCPFLLCVVIRHCKFLTSSCGNTSIRQ